MGKEKRNTRFHLHGACSVESDEPHSSAAGPALPDRLLDRRAGREPPELRLERLVFGNDHLNYLPVWTGGNNSSSSITQGRGRRILKEKKENGQPKGGMGGRHAATTQGF